MARNLCITRMKLWEWLFPRNWSANTRSRVVYRNVIFRKILRRWGPCKAITGESNLAPGAWITAELRLQNTREPSLCSLIHYAWRSDPRHSNLRKDHQMTRGFLLPNPWAYARASNICSIYPRTTTFNTVISLLLPAWTTFLFHHWYVVLLNWIYFSSQWRSMAEYKG